MTDKTTNIKQLEYAIRLLPKPIHEGFRKVVHVPYLMRVPERINIHANADDVEDTKQLVFVVQKVCIGSYCELQWELEHV